MNENKSFENRIFKLSTGEKVDPAELEKDIENVCHYVKFVTVAGSGEDQPVALIFPDKNLLVHPDYEHTPEEGCFCPRSLNELGRCLTGCLHKVNRNSSQKIESAAIINSEIETTDSTENVIEKYKALLKKMHTGDVPSAEDIYIVKLGSGK